MGALTSTEQRQRVAEIWVRQAIKNAPQHTLVRGLGVAERVANWVKVEQRLYVDGFRLDLNIVSDSDHSTIRSRLQ